MTGTDAADCQEVDGPSSGVGVDYHFDHINGAAACAVHDRTRVSISITDRFGDEAEQLEFDLPLYLDWPNTVPHRAHWQAAQLVRGCDMTSLAIDRTAAEAALDRLIAVARSDTGQARRVANFLLAWWNGPELGDFPVADLFGLDLALGRDVATIVGFLADAPGAIYADAFGHRAAMDDLVARWRPELLTANAAA